MSAPASSQLATFTTSVNFVLGAGVLGLPYAMSRAGVLASALALGLVAVISFMTCSWLLEVLDRANAMQNELARCVVRRTVQHANGDLSVLPLATLRDMVYWRCKLPSWRRAHASREKAAKTTN